MHVLVVDDEKEIADLVELYLSNEGYIVHKYYRAEEALTCVASRKIDLALLDVMLPDTNGFSICKTIREKHTFPIIMLTAKVEDIDKITGLTIGADDYMTKPFSPLEMVARVKAQLRRYTRYNPSSRASGDNEQKAEEFDFRGLVINKTAHTCTLYDEPLPLTPSEFSILWYLCENMGRVVSSEELFENVWGEKYLDDNNTVMAHVARLREKMHEIPRKPKFVKTIWGVGYKIEQD